MEYGDDEMSLSVQDICEHYGVQCIPTFMNRVTFTSIATSPQEVSPGALYAPTDGVIDLETLRYVTGHGAYGVFIASPNVTDEIMFNAEIPVLHTVFPAMIIGDIAAHLYGTKRRKVANFVIFGVQAARIIKPLYKVLHVLGCSLSILEKDNACENERSIDIQCPLPAAHVHRLISIFAEDGAYINIIAANAATLDTQSLQSLTIDMCATAETLDEVVLEREKQSSRALQTRRKKMALQSIRNASAYFGINDVPENAVVYRTADSDELAEQIADAEIPLQDWSSAIALVMKAGITKNKILTALSVAKEFTGEYADVAVGAYKAIVASENTQAETTVTAQEHDVEQSAQQTITADTNVAETEPQHIEEQDMQNATLTQNNSNPAVNSQYAPSLQDSPKQSLQSENKSDVKSN